MSSCSPDPDNHHRDALRPWFERYDAIGYARASGSRSGRRSVVCFPSRLPKFAAGAEPDFVVTRRQ